MYTVNKEVKVINRPVHNKAEISLTTEIFNSPELTLADSLRSSGNNIASSSINNLISRTKMIHLAYNRAATPLAKPLKIKTGKISPSSLAPSVTRKVASAPKFKKLETLKENQEESVKSEMKSVLENLKRRELLIPRNQPDRKKLIIEKIRENMNIAVKNIITQCEIVRTSREAVTRQETSIEREKKAVKCFTERMQWTSSKLQNLAEYKKDIVKEIYNHECFIKNQQHEDAFYLFKDLVNKSHHQIRSQAKFIKRVLIKNKLKIL